MREVLNRVRGVAKSRWALGFYLALVLAGCTFPLWPLLNLPGYELGAALAVLHGVCGGVVGVVFMRHEAKHPVANRPMAMVSAACVSWAAMVPSLLVAVARSLGTPCDPFATSVFVPVLVIPSGLISASLGGVVGHFTRRWWSAAVAWLVVVVVSAAQTIYPIVFGPQVYAYNHLAGYLPGPLYDEELHLPTSLLWFRVATVALAVFSMALVSRWRSRWLVLMASAALFIGIESQGSTLGFRMSDEVLAQRLGGLRETSELTLHYPSEFDEHEARRALHDAQFRVAQISRFLGGAPAGRVTVWWYASAEQKQRLVGAAHTQFSKPWRREVHVNAAVFPHTVLKHELVHAMAGLWGGGPFGVPGALMPHVGIVEGLAVAADNPIDDLTLHEWAAAMKRKALLPDVREVMTPVGFYSAPASRAYTTAGSFMRFLAETRGAEGLRRLYFDGDFEAAYGTSLATLATQYEAFLDTLVLDETAVNQAFSRFKQGSIFERPCAREVARLQEEAGGAPAGTALALARRCAVLQPAEPSHRLAEARALSRLHRDAEAVEVLDASMEQHALEATVWADAALERAAIASRAHDEARVKQLLEGLLARHPSVAIDRTARVWRSGLASASERERDAVSNVFAGANERTKTWRLRDLDSRAWPVAYLLGRRLAQENEPLGALAQLEGVLASDGVPADVRKESVRLAVEAAFNANRCDRVSALASTDEFGRAFRLRLNDWVERCEFAAASATPN